MTGMEVLARLRELDPDARVVIASADVQSSTREEAQTAGAIGFINKPFEREQVLNTVANVLAGGMAWN
jgi:two-component system chemotaxis response regulator CheY